MTYRIPPGFMELATEFSGPTIHNPIVTWGINYPLLVEDFPLIHETLDYAWPDIMQDIHFDYDVRTYRFTVENPEGTFGSFEIGTTPIGGGSTDTGTSPQNAYLVKKHTMVVGRGTTGRFYLPGVSESKIDEQGRLNGAWLTDMGNHVASFFEKLLTGDPDGAEYPVPMYLFHKGEALTVSGLELESFSATQRRRMPRI